MKRSGKYLLVYSNGMFTRVEYFESLKLLKAFVKKRSMGSGEFKIWRADANERIHECNRAGRVI